MGMMPLFFEGSRALYHLINENTSATKLYAGGDTLQELKNLCPGIYMNGLDDPKTYYFTGGGSVLAAIEQGSPLQNEAFCGIARGGTCMTPIPIFEPDEHQRPMRVAAFMSGSGTNIMRLLEHEKAFSGRGRSVSI